MMTMKLLAILYYVQLPVIQKVAAEDTVLSTVNAAGEAVTVPIPAGAGIGIHTPGLHYNRELYRLLSTTLRRLSEF